LVAGFWFLVAGNQSLAILGFQVSGFRCQKTEDRKQKTEDRVRIRTSECGMKAEYVRQGHIRE
jgi:hypothetical protein